MLGRRVFRLLLLFYPRRFRKALGSEMTDVFEEHHRAARARQDYSPTAFWARTFVDALMSGLRERTNSTFKILSVETERLRGPRRRRLTSLDTLLRDISYAQRLLIRSPLFALTSVLVLAVGIAATTTVFSLVSAVLFEPLPYPNGDRLVHMWEMLRNGESKSVSYPNYRDWRSMNRVFDDMGGSFETRVTLTGYGDARIVPTAAMTPSAFTVLGTPPLRGRTFTNEENEIGAPSVAVISERFWRELGERALIGESLTLDGAPVTIVGIMPREFEFPAPDVDLWLPIVPLMPDDVDNRDSRPGTTIVARLKDGVTLARAREDMDRVARVLETSYPEANENHTVGMRSLRDRYVGDVRGVFWVLLSAVGVVLIVASANVANLLLARGSERTREMAVRFSLGAGRARLVRQLLTESVMLGLMAGVVGLTLAYLTHDIATNLVVSELGVDQAAHAALDLEMLAFCLGLSMLVSVGFGIAPAVSAANAAQSGALRTRGGGSRTAGLRRVLIVSEVALSVVLLAAGGVMFRSLHVLTHSDPGFRVAGIVSMRTNPAGGRYATNAQRRAFYTDALARVGAVPGVTHAAAVHPMPLVGWGNQWGVNFEDSPTIETGESIRTDYFRVTPGYFAAMQIPLFEGRDFTPFDDTTSTRVAIVDRALADRFYPDGAIGRRVRIAGAWREIVGVAGSVKNYGVNRDTRIQLYLPITQNFVGALNFVVRVEGEAEAYQRSVRDAIAGVDREVPVYMMVPLAYFAERNIARERVTTFLLTGFAAAALTIAMVGLYGVISYLVSSRKRELGIRVALGANARGIVKLVLRQGLLLAGVGVALGLGAAAGVTRVLSHLLFGVGPTDLVTYVAVSAGLLTVTALACVVPARRALRVDPVNILRAE